MELERIGRYEVVAQLGQGAMGLVYKAIDPLMDRTVAIKTILAAALAGPQAAEYRERFQREARAAGRLSHPGIITVYDVGEHEGLAYLVMEFVAGRTLAAALDSGERFSFERIYEIGQQLAEALGYAHAHGVIHRDIKPANILLAAPPGGGPERAKIMDFGVAKLSAAQVTVTGQLLGTPSFMPPEQFTGAPIDGRSDLFSLGVILYWMATGDKPFSGDTITAVSYKIVHTDTIPPRRLNPAISADFERVIVRCLQKDPAARYATGEALARDLAELRAGRPLERTAVASSGRAFDPDATADLHVPPQYRASHAPEPAPLAAAEHVPAVARKRWSKKRIALVVIAIFALVSVLKKDGDERGEQPQQQAESQTQKAPESPVAAPDPAAAGKVPPAQGDAEKSAAKTSPADAAAKTQVDAAELARKINEQTMESLRKAGVPADGRNFVMEKLAGRDPMRRELAGKHAPRPPDAPLPIPEGRARLRIDASRLPPGIHVSVQSDGGVEFNSTDRKHAGQRVFENQFMAPGTQTLHVSVGAATMKFGSEVVEGEFTAGEVRTLRVELIFPGGASQPRREPRGQRVFGGDLRVTLE